MPLTMRLALHPIRARPMTRSSIPYLRLGEVPDRSDTRASVTMHDGLLLGFVDMSRASDVALETIMSRLRPAWVFDLRPVPYFNIGRMNRKRAFELFRSSSASYRDVAGLLRITEHNDASLNSGAVGSFLSKTLAMRPLHAPVVVLVNDHVTLAHAMHVLPLWLRSSFGVSWRPLALDVEVRDGIPDLLVRDAKGVVRAFEAKWLGDRELASASAVEAFRLWTGDELFAITFEFDGGHATQVSLPLSAAVTLEHHLGVAIARCRVSHDRAPSPNPSPRHLLREPRDRVHVVAARVERVRIREVLDGHSILLTFDHLDGATTHALFTVDGAKLLRSEIQALESSESAIAPQIRVTVDASPGTPSTCTTTQGARDYDVLLRVTGARRVCETQAEVTLVPGIDGELSTWGQLDHWLSSAGVALVRKLAANPSQVRELSTAIEVACRSGEPQEIEMDASGAAVTEDGVFLAS
jgi:hypothetical protein